MQAVLLLWLFMAKTLVSTLAITLFITLGLAGCNSLEGMFSSQEEQTSTKQEASSNIPSKQQAIDLNTEAQATNHTAQSGGLVSDANVVVDMQNNPNAVQSNVSRANNLEKVQASQNAILEAAPAYDNVNESVVEEDISLTPDSRAASVPVPTQLPYPPINQQPNQAMQPMQPMQGAQNSPSATTLPAQSAESAIQSVPPAQPVVEQPVAPKPAPVQPTQSAPVDQGVHIMQPIYNNEPQAASAGEIELGQAISNTATCSTKLDSEASGLARTLIKELAGRLRNETGLIFVAPTIIDREYSECINDLSYAIQDGLLGSVAFNIVPATTNINNIISQNIGSATVIPSLVHQCRASAIPYLVISQIRKTGAKAALTIRIIRTDDGITLGQTFRRLSQ